MVYCPAVGRLDQGSNSVEHRGFWQMDGYGLVAMYKSDWIRVGGKTERNLFLTETKVMHLLDAHT